MPTTTTFSNGSVHDMVVLRLGGGVNGSGVVLRLFFNATSIGNASVHTENVVLAASNGSPMSSGSAAITMSVVNSSDADNDGVPNARDKCPNTTLGVIVGRYGCPLPPSMSFTPDLSTNLTDVDPTNITSLRLGITGVGQIDWGSAPISVIT